MMEWSRLTDTRASQKRWAFQASTCPSGLTIAMPRSEVTLTLAWWPRGWWALD